MSVAAEAATARLHALEDLLARAKTLAAQLVHDPLVERILRAFARLPGPDREPILRVIERDATWCRIVEQTADTTGITVRPNPHASLYLHVFGSPSESWSEPLRRDVDVIRFGIERFVHMLPLFLEEGVHAQWTAAARELIREAPPELRRAGERLAREVLALIAEADASAGAESGAPARPEPGAPTS